LVLSEYIKNQLLFNGRVTLPGLGSLVLIKGSARIKGKKISPPGTWVGFNPDLIKDDDKLTRSLASAEEIDIEDARQKVLEFIDEIVFTLNKGETFIFDGIGKLFRDNDNMFQFEKDESFIIDFDSFGLESFDLEPLEEEVAVAESSPADKSQSQSQSPSQPQSQSQSQPQPQPQPQILSPVTSDKNNRNIFWILSGSVVIILTGFIVLKMTTEIFDNPSFTFFNFGEKDSLVTVTESEIHQTGKTLPAELEATLDSMARMENALVPETNVPVKTVINPVSASEYKEFHIIAGSFKDPEYAQKLAKDLSMKVYPATILEQGDNLYRVSALSFKDKATGLKELQRFRGQTKNNAAWLLGLN
jgi:hypothetical protein